MSEILNLNTPVLLQDQNLRSLLVKAKYDIHDIDNAVKWKSYDNQIVLRGENCYYKLYKKDYSVGYFFCLIREKLGEIYREKFGIKWEINTYVVDNTIYQIERREALEVATESKISFSDIMKNWSNTLSLLEKRIGLQDIVWSLPDELNIRKIKLVRDCVNDYKDYGLTRDGNVVLLDDTDWFLAPIDKSGNWVRLPYNVYNCELNGEMYGFAPSIWKHYGNISLEIRKNEKHNMWTLVKNMDLVANDNDSMMTSREQMLDDNISVLLDPSQNKSLIAFDEEELEVSSKFYLLN